jgi:RecA/RadA recombinase
MKVRLREAALQVRVAAKQRKKERTEEQRFLNTGCSLLNLAISDRVEGGFPIGRYTLLNGDSASGKTFLTMTSSAEAMRRPDWEEWDLFYNGTEGGMSMDVRRLFGKRVSKRLKQLQSESLEEFYYDVDDRIQHSKETGRPFLYVLDSMDGIDAEDDQEKFEKRKKAHRSGKEETGSYGMAKAKLNSTSIRRVQAGLLKTGSILIVICQSRDSPGAMGYGPKRTRAGGRALKFYADVEIWSSRIGELTRKVRGKTRKIGAKLKLQVSKNRITGKLHEVETAVYPSYGIDDVGTCIDWLVSEGWFKKSKGAITTDNGLKKQRDQLVSFYEESPKGLMMALQECWSSIEQAKNLERRSRYS